MDNEAVKSKTSLSAVAYDQIKTMILNLTLKPGSSLTETWLIERLQMSRTPIREALNRLQQDRLVELTPRKGWFVSEMKLRDVQEVFMVREALEGIAARHAATRVPDVDLADMEGYLASMEALLTENEDAVEDPGDSIHELIFSYCGNELINEMMSVHLERLKMFHLITSSLPGRKLQSWHEHRDIFAALKARDEDGAERAMRAHVRSSQDSLLRSLMENKVDYQRAMRLRRL